MIFLAKISDFFLFFFFLGRLLKTWLNIIRPLKVKNDSLGQTLLDVDLVQFDLIVEHVNEVLIGVEADLILILIEVGKGVVDGHFGEVIGDDIPELMEGFALMFHNFVFALIN